MSGAAARRAASLAATAALAGCAVGPDYVKPTPSVPAAFTERAGEDTAHGSGLSRVTSDTAAIARWWTQFNDPELDRLVARALAGNLTLAQASARLRQAREQVTVARAALFPTLGASANAYRLDTQARTITGLGGGMAGAGAAGGGGTATGAGGFATPDRAELIQLGLNASWEIDLFGGTRRGVEAARARADAAVWSVRDTQVSVASEVADAYLQLRTDQARLAVLQIDLKRLQGLFKLVGDRFRAGFVTNLDVNQQRTALAATQAQIPQLEADAAAQRHALGVLLGAAPETLDAELASAAPLPPVPPTLPAGLPSTLLQQRPDIRAAERQLAAANAEIGVATAAQFPTLNLSLLPSYSAFALADMFQKPARTLLGEGQVMAPIFQAGRLRAQVRSAQAARDEALAVYTATAMTALRDVEDALVRYDADQRRWTALSASFKAAQSSYAISRQQYGVGLVDYASVYQTQASLIQVQDQLTQADAALGVDVVTLYRALGGGWS